MHRSNDIPMASASIFLERRAHGNWEWEAAASAKTTALVVRLGQLNHWCNVGDKMLRQIEVVVISWVKETAGWT